MKDADRLRRSLFGYLSAVLMGLYPGIAQPHMPVSVGGGRSYPTHTFGKAHRRKFKGYMRNRR